LLLTLTRDGGDYTQRLVALDPSLQAALIGNGPIPSITSSIEVTSVD